MQVDEIVGMFGTEDAADEASAYAKAFELPFQPPDWRNSLGFFLPLPTPKPTEARPVEVREVPDLPMSEPPGHAIQELVELMGTGGASSRAIAERLHKFSTMAPGAAPGPSMDEEEEEVRG